MNNFCGAEIGAFVVAGTNKNSDFVIVPMPHEVVEAKPRREPIRNPYPLIGRNGRCPCGSGTWHKFKRCPLRRINVQIKATDEPDFVM